MKNFDESAPKRPPIILRKKKTSRATVKKFLTRSCGVASLDEKLPITSLVPDISGGNKPYYTVVAWAENRFNKRIDNQFVENRTIGELIDVLCL